MSAFVRLLSQKFNPPAETTESFAGKTVLVTGTTSGLGLEAAKKLAILNTSKLIITARTIEKGKAARDLIQQHIRDYAQSTNAKTVVDTEIVVLPLDMSSLAGVQGFVSTLTSHLGDTPIDAAILNAGVSQRTYTASPDGYEETMQVNVISTTILAMLLMPLLISSSQKKGRPSHLMVVSSGLANSVTNQSMSPFITSQTPVKDLSIERNFPPGGFGGQKQYARSKLILEHAMRHVAALPNNLDDSSGKPKVIVNSTCPGMCESDLGRQFTGSLLAKIAIWIVFALFARSASQGANSYISALTRNEKCHGAMWKDDKVYPAGEMITSDEGRAFGDKAWEELEDIYHDLVS